MLIVLIFQHLALKLMAIEFSENLQCEWFISLNALISSDGTASIYLTINGDKEKYSHNFTELFIPNLQLYLPKHNAHSFQGTIF